MTTKSNSYMKGFIPYGLAAFLVGVVGGFAAILGPAFVKDIGIAYNNTTWTALALATSSAAFAPVLGKLGDVIGLRRTLLLGIGIFALGNALTAIASSLLFMLIARFVVGIGTAAVAPIIMAYILRAFPKDKVGTGFALYMLISSSAVIFGPTIGGLIISAYNWRVMMWVCTAISAIVLILCMLTLKRDNITLTSMTDFDGFGAVMILIFFSLVLCVPSFGQNFGWHSLQFVSVVLAGLLSLIGLVIAEGRAKKPILDGGFIKRRVFIVSVLALFLTQGLMQANMTNVIVFVNYTQPNNTIISGYAISIMYLGMSLGAIFLGPLADRVEPKKVLLLSFTLTAVGCALMLLFSGNTSVLLLALSLGVLGLGLGGNGTIFMKVVLSGVPAEQSGTGTGTYGLFRDLTAPFGVAVFVPLFTNRVAENIARGMDSVSSAIEGIKFLGSTELLCVGIGIFVLMLLPKVRE